MDMLINLVNILASDTTGMVYIGIGLMAIGMAASGIGEGLVCAKTVESMGRNPDMYGKLRTAMIHFFLFDITFVFHMNFNRH